MRAIEISTPGAPDVLRLVDRRDPSPGPGEVLINVSAAGVNRPDLMQREGHYPPPKDASDIPGLEIAGRIAALGGDSDLGPPQSANGRRWAIGMTSARSSAEADTPSGRSRRACSVCRCPPG